LKTQHKTRITLLPKFFAVPTRWALARAGTLSYQPLSGDYLEFDPWHIRERFLGLNRDDQQLVRFLNDVGNWDLLPSLRIQDYWEWQETLTIAIANPATWQDKTSLMTPAKAHRLSYLPNYSISLTQDTRLNNAVLSCVDRSVLDAIIASIHFDRALLLRRRVNTKGTKRAKPVKKSSPPVNGRGMR
jgi:hypothetical protein